MYDCFENLNAEEKIFDDLNNWETSFSKQFSDNPPVTLDQIPFESLLRLFDQPQNDTTSMSQSSFNRVNESSYIKMEASSSLTNKNPLIIVDQLPNETPMIPELRIKTLELSSSPLTSEDNSHDLNINTKPPALVENTNCIISVYKCTKCNYQTNLNASSWMILQHWVTRHDPDPRTLELAHTTTGQKLRAENLYNIVARCSAPGCDKMFGSNARQDSQLYHIVRTHWRRKHSEEEECRDKDKTEILIRRIETGVMECEMDYCGWRQKTQKNGWRQKCLNHFIEEHSHDLTQFRFQDSRGHILQLQDIFSYVGQCSQEDCFIIKASTNKTDLVKCFTNHYKKYHLHLTTSHHFKHLVVKGKVKLTDNVTSITENHHQHLQQLQEATNTEKEPSGRLDDEGRGFGVS